MKLTITYFLLIASIGLLGQQTDVVSGKQYQGAIFSSDYTMPSWTFTIEEKKFTPTVDEIDKIEIKLKLEINDLNVDQINQGQGYGPVIHKNSWSWKRWSPK